MSACADRGRESKNQKMVDQQPEAWPSLIKVCKLYFVWKNQETDILFVQEEIINDLGQVLARPRQPVRISRRFYSDGRGRPSHNTSIVSIQKKYIDTNMFILC